ncbi:hypothetical protein [Undibacterium sp.]|uniref:hypothetical protein n=1 Tax=Undibacterium sp. TaxID=1914977 RepID=UPI00374FDF48
MTVYTIPQKMSNTGSIHDIASSDFDREIKFNAGAKFAVVRAAYYGGKGYSTHKTAEAAAAASRKLHESHEIICVQGKRYILQQGYYGHTLVAS